MLLNEMVCNFHRSFYILGKSVCSLERVACNGPEDHEFTQTKNKIFRVSAETASISNWMAVFSSRNVSGFSWNIIMYLQKK
jgi:hypothetical protein